MEEEAEISLMLLSRLPAPAQQALQQEPAMAAMAKKTEW
jgi:hypothetical protein